ncbi:MerR family transcriptional regulator [Microbacterium sp. K24]|uniref:MerR family transcriptional regulator n=1 Tax=Microbacterium sp. K24 TaxID=2305446 RepID=UPI001F0E1D11|nr:MerR family transcriptional regulator [Microbacterium sp. K24]
MAQNPQEYPLTTAGIGRLVGYSTQQVRDLERLRIIPPAERAANGYRRYGDRHLVAARAYRSLAAALGPVPARRLMPTLVGSTVDVAAEQIDDLHAALARERSRVREALRGLEVAIEESGAVFADDDALTIGELAQALDVRASALRHWEREGLIHPLRSPASAARTYGARAITEARIVAALRAGGYGIPPIARILEQLRTQALTADAQRILAERLADLSRRSVALLAAAGELHALLDGLR